MALIFMLRWFLLLADSTWASNYGDQRKRLLVLLHQDSSQTSHETIAAALTEIDPFFSDAPRRLLTASKRNISVAESVQLTYVGATTHLMPLMLMETRAADAPAAIAALQNMTRVLSVEEDQVVELDWEGNIGDTSDSGDEWNAPRNLQFTVGDFGKNGNNAPKFIPNDPYFERQWELKSIRAPEMWSYVQQHATTDNEYVRVLVVDSGTQQHVDVKANLWVNQEEFNGVKDLDDDANGYVDDIYGWSAADNTGNINPTKSPRPPYRYSDHGGAVSGVIAGTRNNEIGLAGVGVGVKVSMCRIDSAASDQVFLSSIIKCLDYGFAIEARVFNHSWGGLNKYSDVLRRAIYQTTERGVVWVNSAGNRAWNMNTHTRYPVSVNAENMIFVAAMKLPGNEMADWSAYGNKIIHLTAPGTNLTLLEPENKYDVFGPRARGTSFAAPMVSAVAATILYLKPLLSAEEVILSLCASSKTFKDSDKKVRFGRLDALDAVRYATGAWQPPKKPSFACGSTTVSRLVFVVAAGLSLKTL